MRHLVGLCGDPDAPTPSASAEGRRIGVLQWAVDARPIGLTGGIASGKSTVLAMLAKMGLRTASSDQVAREVFELPEIQEKLASLAGIDGPVDRSVLRAAILARPSLRRDVNRLMHPVIGERTAALKPDVVEVPLLFEACLQHRYREVWVAVCGPEETVRRLRERYGENADLEALTAWQLSERVKSSLGDLTLRTDRPPTHVLRSLHEDVARCFPTRIAPLG